MRAARIVSVIAIGLALALAVLAAVTLIGTAWIERRFPPDGRFVDVAGGRLHVVELGPRDGAPIVLIHGASANGRAMRLPVGDRLAQTHRVILIDRPGHGWSTRDDPRNALPAAHAAMIDEALGKLGVENAVLVVHSLAGAVGAAIALDHARRFRGMVMLAPVTHRWSGGVGAYNAIMTRPAIGALLAHTITLPLGLLIAPAAARAVFQPQPAPDDFIAATATPLLLRPQEFLANAWDLAVLKDAVTAQAPRYPAITLPVTIISGDADGIVYTDLHSRAFAAAVPQARLVILPQVGHMVQNAAPEIVVREIEAMLSRPPDGAEEKPSSTRSATDADVRNGAVERRL